MNLPRNLPPKCPAVISPVSDLFPLKNFLSGSTSPLPFSEARVLTSWHFSTELVFYLILYAQNLLFLKLEISFHWPFHYSAWSLGSIWLATRFPPKVAAASPEVSLASYFSTAQPTWVLRTSLERPQGAATNVVLRLPMFSVWSHPVGGRILAPGGKRGSLLCQAECCKLTLTLRVKLPCHLERSSLARERNGEKGGQYTDHNAVPLLSFQF